MDATQEELDIQRLEAQVHERLARIDREMDFDDE